MSLKGLAQTIQNDLTQITQADALNTDAITVHYDLAEGVNEDRNLEATLESVSMASTVVKGLVHFVSPETGVQRGFTEVDAGDVIVDFPGSVQLPGRWRVMEIQGKRYVQKEIGKDLQASWDTVVEGRKMTLTFLLRPET